MSGASLTLYVSIFLLCLYLIGLAMRKILFLREAARMRRESRGGARVVATVNELTPGSVKKFRLICRKQWVDGFLINYDGRLHAYVNRCRHMTTPLDFVRNQFFTEDGRHLICLTHGALYDPESGACIEGPCKGLSLYRLPLVIDKGEVLVGCPAGDLSFLDD
ncbi:MAG TPA: Rieske 2Fe-2S domain-containing protein [Candidatus Acidoferrales bacterium]|nr:Rieske 2Fe-2S domain-containing protein [Candidatus Acidoferrales bacterium]